MKRVDVALVALGLVALAATAAAFVKGDDWAGVETIGYDTASSPLAAQGPKPAGAGAAEFSWMVPDNATGAHVSVQVAFTGQAFQGGSATVSITLVAPDGTLKGPQVHSFQVPAQAVAGGMTYNATMDWLEVPEPVEDDPQEHQDARHWADPFTVRVAVERPGDVAVATYAFEATVSGTVTAYERA